MSLALWFDHRRSEVRHALRMIRKTPTASAVAVLSLALGIGANTAIFSFVDTLLLKTLAVQAPDELYQVARQTQQRPAVSWNYPDYCAFRDRTKAFSGIIAYSSSQPIGMQVVGEGGASAEIAYAAMVSGNYFQVLGVEPALGHLFSTADDKQFGASPYAVLGYDYWQRRFAGDPQVVGRTVRLNGYPLTIVGVARRGFKGLDVTTSPNLYVPMTMRTELSGVAAGIWNTRFYWWIQVVGRLAPGAALAQASSEVSIVYRDQEAAARRADTRPAPNRRQATIFLTSAARGYSGVRNTLEKPLIVLMVVVGLVLLIACANVANLMLARAAARQREMAVRLAVGATRSRLAAQMLVESIMLSLAGGLAGLAFAYACVRALLVFLPQIGGMQVNLQVSPDARLLAFTFVVSVVTGTLFGLAPALQASRPNPVRTLKDETAGAGGGRRRVTLRRLLVVAQVALSLLLVVGAGLFVRTLQNLRDVEVGFRSGQAMVMTIDPSRNGYKGQRLREFYERLREGVGQLPGVRAASLAAITPLGGSRWNQDVAFEGYTWKAGEEKFIDMNAITPRYFESVGIPLLFGRDFLDTDNPAVTPDPSPTIRLRPEEEPLPPGPRVIIVSEGLVKRFFNGRNPVGMHVCLQAEYDPSRAYEIVGVVKDAHYFGLREAATPMLYLPVWAEGASSRVLCLRTSSADTVPESAVRRLVTTIDPAVPVLRTRTLQEEVDNQVVVERLIATLSSFFGLLALLLAGIGLYGVMSYAVSGRTREIGIRMALGAPRASVLWLVARDAALLVGVGSIIGVPAALWLTRLVKTFLYEVKTQDPVVIAAGIGLLVLVGVTACLVPARRATAIEPNSALRCE